MLVLFFTGWDSVNFKYRYIYSILDHLVLVTFIFCFLQVEIVWKTTFSGYTSSQANKKTDKEVSLFFIQSEQEQIMYLLCTVQVQEC